MTVLGIHATSAEIAGKIRSSSFKPGPSLANYLGEGVYFYLVHGDRGYRNAIECAARVAGRHHQNVAYLAAQIDVKNALNLQNPVIQPLFASFGNAFDRRLARLGVVVEPNDNASYYRPVSHLKIEAFRRCIEAIGGREFDVLGARFALKSPDIDIELPHEICVKRARAILSVEPCQAGDRTAQSSLDPARWPCSDDTAQAAEKALDLVANMDDGDLLDLIVSIYRGSEGCWNDPSARFDGPGSVHFLYDERRQPHASETASLVADAGHLQHRRVELFDLARIARTAASNAQSLVRGLVANTAGVVALVGSADVEVVSLLVTIADARPRVPIMAMLTPGQDVLSEDDLPIVMRSRHNLCCLRLPEAKALTELTKGFLRDRWTDALVVLDIESKMAARHGSQEARHRDARQIIEAYHARQRDLL